MTKMRELEKPHKKYVSNLLETKLNAIKELQQGKSTIKEIAIDLQVHPTTVQKWQKQNNKIEDWAKQLHHVLSKRKRVAYVENDCVDKLLWMWFQQKRSCGVPISGLILQQKAKEFNNEFGGKEDFSASNGWLRSWKSRYNIRSI